jgi:hypothetical protein
MFCYEYLLLHRGNSSFVICIENLGQGKRCCQQREWYLKQRVNLKQREWYLKQREWYIPVSLSHTDQYKVQCFWNWNVSGWRMRKNSHFYKNGVQIPGQTEVNNSVRWVDGEGRVIRACLTRLEEHAGGEKRASGSWVLLSVALTRRVLSSLLVVAKQTLQVLQGRDIPLRCISQLAHALY